MRRRPPPTALRLVPGPVPPRNAPKYTLPSLPWPIHTEASNRPEKRRVMDLPPIQLSMPVAGSEKSKLRGPWDHSSSISVEIDVERLLAPLKPAVVRRCSI
ncbi:hypothetical protein CC1G_13954 [Coprinopsis cinerea okayama7|uniref:Uncharacterized protein n=1 Tax=Coprinopsis cinerea (strain Okayama-7 / 130 / ATCC MYA-4618 / FGSC 9003) TaxID=240176 RepID=D6RKY4_COPC7|nr:hypothetical protein CC1G_13954 [Coprinopsis cinerea okayama7\|eukprot:XP_002911914.1 hypothetical protein CC1G_13954 [Coprinopsis cinerea okayama7\